VVQAATQEGLVLVASSSSLAIILMVVWSFWLGLIVTLVGLIAFGGFAKGKWY
jgi:hypothetical protein